MGTISTLEALRELYPPVLERARIKTLHRLDAHCRRFIGLSPFVCLGTAGEDGLDVTPRGDQPGFVHVLDDTTLGVPDWRGNNRLDSLANIVANPQVGLLFLVPGVDETLRVNGVATIQDDAELTSRWQVNGNHPRTVLVVKVKEAFLHCGKALIRSRLWHADAKIHRSQLPSYGQMLKDQIAIEDTAEEIQTSVEEAYRTRLY
ncbi:MAG: pyridoxamine 5'-phosphate oxidase family protein [Bryobacterales bacterium]|nr:pyridoxamine 5'-phosphate oxidase family protein [Bryobacterales bacterium]